MPGQNPYKGLFPYTSEDEKIFFGREKETADLVEMIRQNKLVILFGESGTGKTSLINAKLFPALQQQYYFPIYIRINYASDKTPIEQVRITIQETLRSWDESVGDYTEGMSLLEFASHTRLFSGLVKPILFFDQFEELFTIAPRYVEQDDIREFIDQLAELIETDKIASQSNIDEPDAELENRNQNLYKFRVVLSLRQDFISQLDDFRIQIPSISNCRYRIKKFNYIQAVEAVIGPPASVAAGSQQPPLMDDATAMLIVKELGTAALSNNEYVAAYTNLFPKLFPNFSLTYSPELEKLEIDPTILSLYCYQLFNEMKAANAEQITAAQVARSSCDNVIRKYYVESKSSPKLKEAIENFLITADGRRVLLLLSEFLEKGKVTEQEVEDFRTQTAIVRIYGSGDSRQVEIAHDRIARIVLQKRKEREANKIKTTARKIFAGTMIILGLIIIVAIVLVRQQQKKVSVKELQSTVSTLSEKKNQLETEVSTLQNNYSEQSKSFEKTQTEFSELIKQNTTLNKEFIYQKDSLLNTTRTLSALRSNYSILAERNLGLQTDLSNAQSNLQKGSKDWEAKYRYRGDSLTKALQNYNTVFSRNQSLEKQLSDSLRVYRNKVNTLQSQISTMQKNRLQLDNPKKIN